MYPKVVVFSCNWGGWSCIDAAVDVGLDYPASVKVVRVGCLARIHSGLILMAFEFGADGVMLLGCEPGYCHFGVDDMCVSKEYEKTQELLEMLGIWKKLLDQSLECYAKLLNCGVKCVAGSDAGWLYTQFDHFWQELEMMVIGGMSPMESIIAATKRAAEAMKLDDEIGSLEVGRQADILIVDSDPTIDVSALARITMVMKDGKIIYMRK